MSGEYNYSGYDEMTMQSNVSDKGKFLAIILCLFFGTLGVHRFYIGRYKSGAVMLAFEVLGWLTSIIYIGYGFLAVSLIWSVVDVFRLIFNGLTDAQGRKLR